MRPQRSAEARDNRLPPPKTRVPKTHARHKGVTPRREHLAAECSTVEFLFNFIANIMDVDGMSVAIPFQMLPLVCG